MSRLLLLGFVFCGIAHAAEPPHLNLAVTPAWKGWTRPGRATEVDIRLSTTAATRATLEVVAGQQTLRTEVDLQPGRVQRLYIPVPSSERVVVTASLALGPAEQREVGVARSELPLLGAALASVEAVAFEGFHVVALAADDLPRHVSGYSSIDALMLDAQTLGAIDQAQLGALLAHGAGCGRVVVVNPDARVSRLLEGAGGCNGRALMSASTLAEAKDLLTASLATTMPIAMAIGEVGELVRPSPLAWNRIAVLLAVYFAVAALVVLFFSAVPALLLMPTFAVLAALALLHVTQPLSQLLIWSEGHSGAQVARYQAWQQFQGFARNRMRVAIPPQLASSVQACEPTQAMQVDLDASRGVARYAVFDMRLFGRTALCFQGSFPVARKLAVEARPEGSRKVSNTGSNAWPAGVLLVDNLVHDLPTLGPGMDVTLDTQAGRPPINAVMRTALMRTKATGVAALWALDLAGVANTPLDSKGWLLVSARSP